MLQSQKEHGKLNWEYTVRFTYDGHGFSKTRLNSCDSYAICDTYCLSFELFTVKRVNSYALELDRKSVHFQNPRFHFSNDCVKSVSYC